MESENLILGQNPNKKDKIQCRILSPVRLKDNSLAYDLWTFYFNKKTGKFEIGSLFYEGMRNFINLKEFFKKQLTEKSHVFINEDNNIIFEVIPSDINDVVRTYVDNKELSFDYDKNKYSIPNEILREIYLRQHHNIINEKWLSNLQKHDKPILRDTKTSSFFVFQNGYIEVTEDKIELLGFDKLGNQCVWKDQIIKHHFEYIPDRKEKAGKFEQFIYNVSNKENDRFNAFISALGYLMHNHFNPTKGQAVIFYDEALTDTKNPKGGTGKGLIVQGLKQLRKTTKIDGKNYKSDDKFKWSNVSPSTQLVWIDETNKLFDFKDLFSCLTDGWQVERKHANKFDIPPEDSPKVVICSNSIIDNKGSSNKRRQFIVELSDYYSRKIITGTEEPIKDEHGILFSEEWDSEEWNKFYSFMLECSQFYLKNGLCNYERKNVEMNLLKQQTCDEFIQYIENSPPQLNTNLNMRELFEEFKTTYLGEDSSLKQRTFTNWIKNYCLSKHYDFSNNGKSNGIPVYQITEQSKSESNEE